MSTALLNLLFAQTVYQQACEYDSQTERRVTDPSRPTQEHFERLAHDLKNHPLNTEFSLSVEACKSLYSALLPLNPSRPTVTMLTPLLAKLYESYKRDIIIQIKNDEQEFKNKLKEIEQIEKGKWDQELLREIETEKSQVHQQQQLRLQKQLELQQRQEQERKIQLQRQQLQKQKQLEQQQLKQQQQKHQQLLQLQRQQQQLLKHGSIQGVQQSQQPPISVSSRRLTVSPEAQNETKRDLLFMENEPRVANDSIRDEGSVTRNTRLSQEAKQVDKDSTSVKPGPRTRRTAAISEANDSKGEASPEESTVDETTREPVAKAEIDESKAEDSDKEATESDRPEMIDDGGEEEDEDEEEGEQDRSRDSKEVFTLRKRKRQASPSSAATVKRFQSMVNPLLSNISSNKQASFFAHRVNPNDAPNYYDLIYSPTDLRTIKSQVKDGTIRDSGELERELQKMFANAIMYNAWDSNISKWAREMQQETETQIALFRSAERKGRRSSSTPAVGSDESEAKRRKK